jgi:hypothetical protein
MSRPRNAVKSVLVTITAPPNLAVYLDDLIAKQLGFGSSRGEVAKGLVWERIRSLLQEGTLHYRPPTDDEREMVAKRIPTTKARAKRVKKAAKRKLAEQMKKDKATVRGEQMPRR